ncbi:endonuclease/exonuclease/phosphatase family protein [Streptomyces sp. NPDC059816]|uniref:endonuclease/exonuclease/phosphatase family protein n=1 Tax=Streptomyces sp. NPDC059816 TaxID=3346960 RepID=UPI0036554630
MSTTPADTTLIVMNLEHDGGPEPAPGVLPERWLRAHQEILKPRQPDLLVSTEMTYSQYRPGAEPGVVAAADRRFRTAQEILGMRGFRAPMGHGRNPTGAFVRDSVFTVVGQHEHPGYRTPPTNLVLELDGVPGVPIMAMGVHLSHCSRYQRRLEADQLTTLADKLKLHRPHHPARAAWILGDLNEYPVPTGELVEPIDWTTVKDVTHRRHRAEPQSDGTWRSATYVDEVLHECGLHDPARWAARRLGQEAALAGTAGYADPDQGGLRRIDRVYMDPWTVQAVTGVEVIDMTGISDHHALQITLSRAKLVEALRRRISPLDRWELVK